MMIFNFTKFFEKEKDIWVRFIGDGQLSLEFRDGESIVPCPPIPYTGDPVNLTQWVPFELIKKSTDFRRIALAQPPVIEILTAEEAQEFYQKKAKKLRLASADAAYTRSEKLRKNMLGSEGESRVRTGQVKDTVREKTTGEGIEVTTEVAGREAAEVEQNPPFEGLKEMVSPKIIGLCNSSVNAHDAIEELEALEERGLLKPRELRHIVENNSWPTVRKWAAKRLAAEAAEAAEEAVDEEDGLEASDAPFDDGESETVVVKEVVVKEEPSTKKTKKKDPAPEVEV